MISQLICHGIVRSNSMTLTRRGEKYGREMRKTNFLGLTYFFADFFSFVPPFITDRYLRISLDDFLV